MTVLDRLFGRRSSNADRQARPPQPRESTECAHIAATPRWDLPEDMGHEDRASSYVCDACHQTLTPAEVQQARANQMNRLRRD